MGDSLVYHAEGNWSGDDIGYRYVADSLAEDGWYAYVAGFIGGTVGSVYRDYWNLESRLAGGDPDALVIALGTNDMYETDGLPTVPLHQAAG